MSDHGFDTIVAPATPSGRSALAIVRVDGPAAAEILARLAPGVSFTPRRATHVRLRFDGEELDDAVVVLYRGPASYSGNDLVEFFLHGNPWLVERLMQAAVSLGARYAEPGEFTERAVLNGRLDLVQAEAVVDLIDSRTALQAKISLRQLGGALSETAEAIRAELLFLISRLEAALDFAEEGYEFVSRSEVLDRVNRQIEQLERMLATYARGKAAVSGLTAVLLGRPNAGKSTMMNFFCGSERAIVTEIPGTTRDLLRETIEIGGLPVTIVDTAGLREEADLVEGIGMERARAEAERAELVLYLVDSAEGLQEADSTELSRLSEPLVIYTKIDRAAAPEGEPAVSIHSGEGVERLMEQLDATVRERYAPPEGEPLVVNGRQRAALAAALEALEPVRGAVESEFSEEIVLVDLYRAAAALGSLTGAITHREIVEEIFANFCIGK